MPIIQCHNRAGLDADTKAQLAEQITRNVLAIIKSPNDLISVIFNDIAPESMYRSGQATGEAIIFCHIRKGRSDGSIERLMQAVGETYAKFTGLGLDEIEVLTAEYPAIHTMRNGQLLPEPPIV
jgi:phenylpyruvate tautomerase PptA (4-oxalocrotonate tautomerase family)